ncbi:MAG: hypothetical protein V7765_02080 [Oleispira sp.]
MSSKKIAFSIVLFLSSLMALGGALNVGVSGQFLTMWFLFPFFYSLRQLGKSIGIKIFIIVGSLYVLFLWNHETNRIIFPLIGSEITLNDQWGYVKYGDSDVESLSEPNDENRKVGKYIKSAGSFKKSKVLEMVAVLVSHPSLVITYSPIFRDQQGNEYKIFAQSLEDEIAKGTVISQELEGLAYYEYQSKFSRWLSIVALWPVLPFIAIAK